MKELSFDEGIREIINFCSDKEFIVGVAGGSGSGKTYISKILADKLNAKIISTDDYYIGRENMKDNNYDHPDAVDIDLLRKQLIILKEKGIEKPIYDFKEHRRKGHEKFNGRKVIVEGIFALMLKDVLDLSIFVDCDEEIRLKRRIERDVKERGRTKEDVLEQWQKTVQPMYEEYVIKQRDLADVIIIEDQILS